MNIKYTVKDNFLNQDDFDHIQQTILGDEFPWFFQNKVSGRKIKSEFFWTHMFFNGYENKGITSRFYPLLDPLIKKLKIKALIRVKANLHSNQGKIIEHEDHSDFPFKHKAALLSLNTCNGFTALAEGTKIKSVANRMLLFDPSILHHSSTCTDAKARWNININYF